MNAPDPNVIAHTCGIRLRRLAESKEWSSRKMRLLRTLFGEFAGHGSESANDLRRLVELVGVRPEDEPAVRSLSAEHVPLIWCGYYGAPMPERIQGSISS